MIITEKIEMRVTHRNIEHFLKLGYNVKNWDLLEIPISDLNKLSNSSLIYCYIGT